MTRFPDLLRICTAGLALGLAWTSPVVANATADHARTNEERCEDVLSTLRALDEAFVCVYSDSDSGLERKMNERLREIREAWGHPIRVAGRVMTARQYYVYLCVQITTNVGAVEQADSQ